jgi:hypothetical protein
MSTNSTSDEATPEPNPYQPPEAPLTRPGFRWRNPFPIGPWAAFAIMAIFAASSASTGFYLLFVAPDWVTVVWLTLPLCVILGIGIGAQRDSRPAGFGFFGLVAGMTIVFIFMNGLGFLSMLSVFGVLPMLSYGLGFAIASLLVPSESTKKADRL